MKEYMFAINNRRFTEVYTEIKYTNNHNVNIDILGKIFYKNLCIEIVYEFNCEVGRAIQCNVYALGCGDGSYGIKNGIPYDFVADITICEIEIIKMNSIEELIQHLKSSVEQLVSRCQNTGTIVLNNYKWKRGI